MSANYVCAKDGRELRVYQNSVMSEELDGNGDAYKVFSGDLLSCPSCGYELLVTAPNPIAEHFQPGYMESPYREKVTIRWMW